MAKDPVCGMKVDETTAKYKVEYMGKTYYFCAKDCLEAFMREPEKYVFKKHGCCC
ncbi:MAG: YHS domain-containing protein [Candidatus Methanomethylicota archaeon]|nr:MAG: YHS domain-containing protein [Candidatus Verstraetearchaeota archaeon]